MSKKFALVLSGGGAKGVYQIGAWKALRELNIKFDIIVGASVGALNAALITQNNYEKAEELWKNIKIEQVLNIPKEVIKNGNINMDIKNINKLLKSFFKTSGFDTAPLKKLILTHLKEETVRKSTTKLGLVTVNKTNLKTEHIFIEDIEKNLLVDYLLASASFPLFKETKIKGKKYLDGGMADNIPFQIVKDSGYKNIIVIDISGLGLNKKPDFVNEKIVYIKNSIEFGTIKDLFGVLNFSKKFLDDFFILGYLDTLKVFEKIDGIKYFIEEDDLSKTVRKQLLSTNEYKQIIKSSLKYYVKPEIALIDTVAEILKINRLNKWSFTELYKAIKIANKKSSKTFIKQFLISKKNKELINFFISTTKKCI